MDLNGMHFVYVLGGKAYINLTNRCHNACTFCIRNTGNGVAGVPLWLEHEPTADEVMTMYKIIRVSGVLKSDEIVFCGFGEPTERLEVLKETAAKLKDYGPLRLNTNGLAALVHGRSIVPELKDIGKISVSLNSSTAEGYAAVTKSAFGKDAHAAVIEFAKECKAAGHDTVFTVVDTIGERDIAGCEEISRATGVPLVVRKYIPDNYGEGK